MTAPNFNADTGGKQNIDTMSRHDFVLNAHPFTVSIEAASFGDGIDFQTHVGNGIWKSMLREPPVKRAFVHHFTLAGGSYRFVTDGASGVVAEITSP